MWLIFVLDRALDRVPDGIRLDRLHALGPAVPGRDRDRPPRRRLCAALGRPTAARGPRGSTPLFAISSLLTPFALGAAVGAIASRRVPGRQRRRPPVLQLAGPTSVLIGVLAVATGGLSRGRVSSPPTPPGSAIAELERSVPRAGADRRRGRRRARDRRARRAALRRSPALPRPGRRCRAARADRLGRSPASATLALVWRRRFEPARYTAALAVAAIIAGLGAGPAADAAAGPDDRAGGRAPRHAGAASSSRSWPAGRSCSRRSPAVQVDAPGTVRPRSRP